MANKDLLKQAIAEAKSVREAAIANAKEALEETLTPHLKDMLAAKLQEMEDSSVEEEVVNESIEEEIEETVEVTEEETVEEEVLEEVPAAVKEAEDDSEESEDEAEEEIEEPAEEEGEEETVEGDEDLGDLTVDQFKDMIRDIIAQELDHDGGEEELGADMDAGDIEGMGDEESMEEPMELDAASDEEEIDLDELLRELDEVDEYGSTRQRDRADSAASGLENIVKGLTALSKKAGPAAKKAYAALQALGAGAGYAMRNEGDQDGDDEALSPEELANKHAGSPMKEDRDNSELSEALETVEALRKDLQEVNLLNSKLLYVNKIFKANSLSESQKVNVIAAFDKAETVKEVKLVFETVSENVATPKKENVTEAKLGMASKATGTTATKPEIIAENSAVHRMQVLAGIKPRQF